MLLLLLGFEKTKGRKIKTGSPDILAPSRMPCESQCFDYAQHRFRLRLAQVSTTLSTRLRLRSAQVMKERIRRLRILKDVLGRLFTQRKRSSETKRRLINLLRYRGRFFFFHPPGKGTNPRDKKSSKFGEELNPTFVLALPQILDE